MDLRTTITVMVMSVATGAWPQTSTESPLSAIPADRVSDALGAVPARVGQPPNVADGIPHQQFNQNAPEAMQEALMASIVDLPGIRIAETQFSLRGSQGWRLEEDSALGPEDAFITTESREFGHLHQPMEGSMHMLLPTRFAAVALGKGWGVIHPLSPDISGENSEYLMIFGPRDEGELETIWIIAQISYYYARGISMEPGTTAITPATLGRIKDSTVCCSAR